MLEDMQMDVRDMSLFADGSFDCVIDKGTSLKLQNVHTKHLI
jgi:hypothetical protein